MVCEKKYINSEYMLIFCKDSESSIIVLYIYHIQKCHEEVSTATKYL